MASLQDFLDLSADPVRSKELLRALDEEPRLHAVNLLSLLEKEDLVNLCDEVSGCEVLVKAYRSGLLSPGLVTALADPTYFLPLSSDWRRAAATIFWFFIFSLEQRTRIASAAKERPLLLYEMSIARPLLAAAMSM